MFALSITHLRFNVEALTPLRLSGYQAGSNLRGALGAVMRRAYCDGDLRDPAHAATCPVCWLLAANEHPGEERRGYALVPPAAPAECYAPGDRFAFGLTLFGSALRYLPYFVLAVPEMGRAGVGPGRGQFAVQEIWAVDPLGDEAERLLGQGEAVVRRPTLALTAERVEAAAAQLARDLAARQSPRSQGTACLEVNFLTPMRLVSQGALARAPDFGILFARLLKRLDELNEQFAGGRRRGPSEVDSLQALADRVRLLEADTRWVEVWSGSSRTERETPLSGLVGRARYAAPLDTWGPLLPWLLWGQAAQVGKDVVKGNGVFACAAGSRRQEAGGRKQEAGSRRQKAGGGRRKAGGRRRVRVA